MKNKQEKFILYLGGGSMAGVFGAGVVSALEKMDIYDRIEAVYGASCGALNGAYFLTKNTSSGSTIYYEVLINNFIYPQNLFKGFIQRILKIFYPISTNKMVNVVDLRYLFNIVKYDSKRKLDIKKLKNQKIPFYIKVFNLSQKKINYLFLQNSSAPYKLLKASTNVVPYTIDFENINGKKYIDGTVVESIGLGYLLKKYPNRKFIIVFNSYPERKFKHYLESFFEGLASIFVYGPRAVIYFLKAEFYLRKDINLIKKNSRILFIHPPKNNFTNSATTDQKTLKETYQMGQLAVEKIKKFIK